MQEVHVPSAFVLSELQFHESKQRVEAKLDQSEVPAKRLESIHRKYQLLWKIGHKSGVRHAVLCRIRPTESRVTSFLLLEGNRRQGKR